nr:aromatic ring-hydroxylating dioxygenase subunit alpha [Sphingosinicella soli]
MRYLKNVWYQAGWEAELDGDSLLSRTLLGENIVMFRGKEGAPQAILDRCPHRFAPLSAGRLNDGVVTCGYHGLSFDGEGRCVGNPHGKPGAIRTRSFPIVARNMILWVWMGDPDQADAARIPDCSFIDETPEAARITGTLPTGAHYQLIVDNIMDLSHADYLHPTTLGGMFTGAKTHVSGGNDRLLIEYNAVDCNPAPAFHSIVPPPQKADVRVEVQWFAAGVMILAAGAQPTGTTRDPGRDSFTLHSITPETDGSAHYFYCSTRPFLTDNVEVSASIKAALEKAFVEEDKPMLELQQRQIGDADFWSLNPLLLPIDSAAVQVRRALDKLIDAEARDER